MVRQSAKTDKTSAPVAAAAPAPVVAAPALTAAPVKEKAAKKVKAVAAESAPAAPAPVVAAPVASDAEVPVVAENSVTKLNEVNAKIQQLTSLLSSLKNDVKSLEKIVAKEQKLAQKSSKSAKKASGNRQPSGFVKPTRISDELARFLGKTTGTEMARTEVSKEINRYIKANNLQLQTNRRIITPDNKLSTLLNLKDGDEQLTYFNLQKYMKPHFIKAAVATA
jgi:chromatin remodeling complex protein RSC6